MNRLVLRLALAISVLVTALLGLGLYLLSVRHFEAMVGLRRYAAEQQNRVLGVALRHQMLEKQANGSLIATILGEVGSQPEMQAVMILDHDGIVRQASDGRLVGQRFSRESAACMVCHDKAPGDRERWAVLELPGGEVLRSVLPIENRQECHACHAPEKRMNGILILDVSLASLRAQLGRDRRWMIGATAALGLLLLGSVGLIVRRLILARLAKLGDAVRAVASGNLARRAEVQGRDAISDLATDFNSMAGAVQGLVNEVKQREAQLANVMNSLDDGLVVLDREFRVVAANQAFCRRFGTHPEAVRGQRCRDELCEARSCEGRDCPTARSLTDCEVRRVTLRLPARNDEPARVEEVHASPVFDENGEVSQVVEIWRDITERVGEQGRLAEIERLESLGALASGFSHEVNTPLATTLACAEAILGRLDDPGPEGIGPETAAEIRDIAETIRGQVLRCRKITDQFRRLARGIPPTTEPVDLSAVVRSIVPLVAPTAHQACASIEIEEQERIPLVRANPEAVQHVLLNLLINATQSFGTAGGTVTVSYQVGDDVRVRIRDTGQGIALEARRYLFEPFRTSRPHGSGIGLFLSRAIMRRFGGDVLLVGSEVGVGSCFEVVFARETGAPA